MARKTAVILFSEAAFRQLKRIRKDAADDISALYNAILHCLRKEEDCVVLPSRKGRRKLAIGPYRVIAEKTESAWIVLRIYRSRTG